MGSKSLASGCHVLVDGVYTLYGYQPSLVAGVIFLALFGPFMITVYNAACLEAAMVVRCIFYRLLE